MPLFLGFILLVLVLALDICHGAEPQSVRQASLDIDGNLAVDVIEAGAATMPYQLTANAVAVYQCLHADGSCPATINRQEVSGVVSGNIVLKANTVAGPLQGLVSGRVTAPPPAKTLVCTPSEGGEAFVAGLMMVRYDAIQLKNMLKATTGVTHPMALGATLRTCP